MSVCGKDIFFNMKRYTNELKSKYKYVKSLRAEVKVIHGDLQASNVINYNNIRDFENHN